MTANHEIFKDGSIFKMFPLNHIKFPNISTWHGNCHNVNGVRAGLLEKSTENSNI